MKKLETTEFNQKLAQLVTRARFFGMDLHPEWISPTQVLFDTPEHHSFIIELSEDGYSLYRVAGTTRAKIYDTFIEREVPPQAD